MSLLEAFGRFKDSCEPTDGVQFSWMAKDIGFGSMYFYISEKDGMVHCNNEYMSKDFLKRMLCKMVDDCVLDDKC